MKEKELQRGPTIASVPKQKIKPRKKKYAFVPMTLDQLISEDYVYIHSYAENFNRQVKTLGLFQNIKDSIDNQFKELNSAIQTIKESVKPSPEVRNGGVLQLFEKDELSKALDDIKAKFQKIYNELKKDKLIETDGMKAIEAFKNSVNRKNKFTNKSGKTVYISVTVNKNPNKPQKYNYYGTALPKTAFANMAKIIAAEYPKADNPKVEENITNLINKAIEDGTENKIPWDEIFKEIDVMDANRLKSNVSVESLRSFNFLVDEIQKLMSSLKESIKDFSINKRQETALMKVGEVKQIHHLLRYDFVEMAKELGFTNEVVQGVNLQSKENVNSIDMDTAVKSNTYNASDIIFSIENAQQEIAISLKHAQDFNKTSNEVNENSFERYGIGQDIINQYKYFMLNYTILSDGNYEPATEEQGKSPRQPLSSFSNLIEMYNYLNAYFGRVFLIQNLLGNALLNPNGITSEKLPIVLVTANHAVFTYDILDNLLTLIKSGVITFKTARKSHNSTHYDRDQFNTLGQLKNLNYKVSEKMYGPSYSEILASEPIKDSMVKITKSAYGDKKKLSFQTRISMAKLVEVVESQNLFEVFRR